MLTIYELVNNFGWFVGVKGSVMCSQSQETLLAINENAMTGDFFTKICSGRHWGIFLLISVSLGAEKKTKNEKG